MNVVSIFQKATGSRARRDSSEIPHPLQKRAAVQSQKAPIAGFRRTPVDPEKYPRIHLDVLVDSTGEQDAEVERLVSLGARRVDRDRYPPEPDFVVLADPDGNVFCVVDLSRAPSGNGPVDAA